MAAKSEVKVLLASDDDGRVIVEIPGKLAEKAGLVVLAGDHWQARKRLARAAGKRLETILETWEEAQRIAQESDFELRLCREGLRRLGNELARRRGFADLASALEASDVSKN